MPSKLREIMKAIEEARNPPGLVIYHFDTGDALAELILTAMLNEAKSVVDLGKGRSIMFHKAHAAGGQDHLHFRVKGSNIAAVNADGTAHDRSHGIQLQRWALDGAKAHYPQIRMPKDGLIEQLIATDRQLLNEEETGPLLDRVLLRLAERRARQALS
jgi:hypothetical protein